jgi:hypothetical protein
MLSELGLELGSPELQARLRGLKSKRDGFEGNRAKTARAKQKCVLGGELEKFEKGGVPDFHRIKLREDAFAAFFQDLDDLAEQTCFRKSRIPRFFASSPFDEFQLQKIEVLPRDKGLEVEIQKAQCIRFRGHAVSLA